MLVDRLYVRELQRYVKRDSLCIIFCHRRECRMIHQKDFRVASIGWVISEEPKLNKVVPIPFGRVNECARKKLGPIVSNISHRFLKCATVQICVSYISAARTVCPKREPTDTDISFGAVVIRVEIIDKIFVK